MVNDRKSSPEAIIPYSANRPLSMPLPGTFHACHLAAWDATFNHDNHHRALSWDGFLGRIHEKTNSHYNPYSWVELPFRPFTIIKNSLRYVFECLPSTTQRWSKSK